jgi:four helix bundle protein
MEKGKHNLQSFTDLHTWQSGHVMVLEVYKATKQFPKDELFALTSQIRRAVVSITSNIAEGFGRGSWAEKSHFYSIALGSLTEVQNQLLVARDVGYMQKATFEKLFNQSSNVELLLKGLMKKTRSLSS